MKVGSAEMAPLAVFEPLLFRGGRFDVQVADTIRVGTLHVGFLLVGDIDVFGE